jgi:hypothetical protein
MMDEQRLREIRERAEKATPGPWVNFHDVIHEDVDEDRNTGIAQAADYGPEAGKPESAIVHMYSWAQHDPTRLIPNAEFIAHAREDVPWLLDALAAREAEVAELKDAIERVDRDANKRGEHTRQGAPSQAHSFTRGMKYAISVIRDYDDPRIDFPALAAPPPGDGAGGEED